MGGTGTEQRFWTVQCILYLCIFVLANTEADALRRIDKSQTQDCLLWRAINQLTYCNFGISVIHNMAVDNVANFSRALLICTIGPVESNDISSVWIWQLITFMSKDIKWMTFQISIFSKITMVTRFSCNSKISQWMMLYLALLNSVNDHLSPQAH
jgi:hypothetical protein